MGRLWVAPVAALGCLGPTLPVLAADPAAPAVVPPHWLLFSGIEGSVQSASGWAGADHAAAGLDSDGLRLRGITGYGRYRTGHPTLPGADIEVDKRIAALMAGHAWVAASWRAGVFAGGEVDARTPSDAAARPGDRGTRGGVAVNAELWAAPAPAVEITASAGLGTARGWWAVRASACARIGAACLGADAEAIGDPAGTELRLGAVATGLSLGALELRLIGGIAWKDDGDSGSYGFLTVWQRF
jgi:hypothetical protein